MWSSHGFVFLREGEFLYSPGGHVYAYDATRHDWRAMFTVADLDNAGPGEVYTERGDIVISREQAEAILIARVL